MTFEKIAMVIIFLAVLLAVQTYLYTRHRSNPKTQASIKGLKVVSRLSLSKTSQLNIVNAGQESFLVVCSKNSPAAIVPLHSDSHVDKIEGYTDDVE